MGILFYARHFVLLACLGAVLAATRRWSPSIGIVATFGIYGALHAAALGLTLRAPRPAGRTVGFVVSGASLSMLCAALGVGASRLMGGSIGMARIALVLSSSSALGAAAYASLIRRFFGAHLTTSAIVTIAAGCMLAALAVLAFYPAGGSVWVAVSWWFALSLGLWFHDRRGADHGRGARLPESINDGTIGAVEESGATVNETHSGGGCTCGFVRYRMIGSPLIVHCCHCRWCQRETGTAFAHNALIEADRVALLQGRVETVDTPSASGKGQKISRCPQCHVAVWSNYAGAGDAMHFVRVGTLDEPDAWPPDIHIYTASKQPWVVLPPGTPAVPAYYKAAEYWPPASLQRREMLKRAAK